MNSRGTALKIAAVLEVIVPERGRAGAEGAADEDAFRRTSELQICMERGEARCRPENGTLRDV
jgi:hypothetical protein